MVIDSAKLQCSVSDLIIEIHELPYGPPDHNYCRGVDGAGQEEVDTSPDFGQVRLGRSHSRTKESLEELGMPRFTDWSCNIVLPVATISTRQQGWSLIRVVISADLGIKGCYLRHWVVLTLYMDLSFVSLTNRFWLAAENVSVGRILSSLETQLVISTQCNPTVAGSNLSVNVWSSFMRITIWRFCKYFHHLWNIRLEWAATA